ncbi:uncharacterized protein LOC108812193 [Raphanus sativus]|uniref:Uncharacterized protein LOC108812193 n=1 Tax=Raphanus sativus TaxID=3726 RepID=A0A6J0JWI0_RAPSA|nr:uncharacterized protein LOC108812193 [Raphanus sativus]
MNREAKKLSQPQPPENKENKLKRERLPVNPMRGLSTRSSGSSSCSSGSHRFLLSHSFSSSSSSSSMGTTSVRPVRPLVSKTPKSAPVLSKPLIRKKLEETKLKSNATEKPQRCRTNPTFGKRVAASGSSKIKGSVLKKQSSVVSREVKLRVDDDSVVKVVTPVSTKLGTGSNLVCRSNADEEAREDSNQEKTPPVQASVSPEMMHCGTSMSLLSASAKSQACYAAGHLLSGVSDKRKCKPKGILTVCENGFEVGKGKIILTDSDEFDEGGSYDDNISMMLPLPADASVHWLLSPCDEEKEDEKEKYETLSPLSDGGTSSDLCNISGGRSLSPMNICKETMIRRTSSSLSPNELSRFRRFMQLSSPKCELEDPSEHLGGDKRSPLSVDTLGSENVIQTPESISSFDSYFRLSSSQADTKHEVGSELESLTATLQSTKLSPHEPSSSSFNFDSLATSSDSIDLSRFQRGLVDRGPRVTRERASRTHVRVSQSEETNSHLLQLKPQLTTDTEFDKEGRKLLPCSAAESISTDGGGGLICSEDSNWMACYNNKS